MPATTFSDDYEQRLLENIARFGWQATHVFSEEDGEPEFSYTVGLHQSFGFPELILIGLPSKIAHSVLNIAAKAADAGTPLNLEEPTDALFEGYPAVFVEVPRSCYAEYVGSCPWYYQGENFPLYQVVWPSSDGKFPWHPEAPESFTSGQPVLGVPKE